MRRIILKFIILTLFFGLLTSCAGTPPYVTKSYDEYTKTVTVNSGLKWFPDQNLIRQTAAEECPYGRTPVKIDSPQQRYGAAAMHGDYTYFCGK